MGCCLQGTTCFEFLKILPTALIALIVAIISFQQWRVAKAKLKLDLFDRRYKIFQITWETLSEVVFDDPKYELYGMATPFNNYLPTASFLFGKEVTEYLNQCVHQWNHIRAVSIEKTNAKSTPESIEQWRVLKNWFEEEASHGCKKIFDPYLDFKTWK